MNKWLAVIFSLLALIPAKVLASGKPDLRPIEHRLVETAVGEEHLVFRDDEQWSRFWHRFSKLPPPEIDFREHDLVLFLMGNQESGGYSVHIKKVRATPTAIRIAVCLCLPPRNISQVMEITSPYALELIPKSNLPVMWTTKTGVTGKGPCRQ